MLLGLINSALLCYFVILNAWVAQSVQLQGYRPEDIFFFRVISYSVKTGDFFAVVKRGGG
jgi:hypothetical protein